MNDQARLSGALGLAGALVTGIGEGLLQWAPGADYADPAYGYLAALAPARQSIGHWMAVLAAPLCLFGYWHLTRNLAPRRRRLADGLFVVAAFGFVLAAVWIGQRLFLALTARAIAEGAASPELLQAFAAHHEPLVMVLRIALVPVSLAWILLIASGESRYPRWMALFSPGLLLAAIFGLHGAAPEVGGVLLPTAMNTVHVAVFGLSLLALAKRR